MKAKEARKLSHTGQALALQKLYFKIEKAAKKGRSTVTWKHPLSEKAIEELKANGYTVNHLGNFFIRW